MGCTVVWRRTKTMHTITLEEFPPFSYSPPSVLSLLPFTPPPLPPILLHLEGRRQIRQEESQNLISRDSSFPSLFFLASSPPPPPPPISHHRRIKSARGQGEMRRVLTVFAAWEDHAWPGWQTSRENPVSEMRRGSFLIRGTGGVEWSGNGNEEIRCRINPSTAYYEWNWFARSNVCYICWNEYGEYGAKISGFLNKKLFTSFFEVL